MDLDHIQRDMFDAVRQPLTAAENMRQRTSDGRSLRRIADEIIKPNDRLTSFERLEIYNRQYWFRVLAALAEDFRRAAHDHRRAQLREAVRRLPAGLPVAVVHAAQPWVAPGAVAAFASRVHRRCRRHRARHGAPGVGRNRGLRRGVKAEADGGRPGLAGPGSAVRAAAVYSACSICSYPVDEMLLAIRHGQRKTTSSATPWPIAHQRRRTRKAFACRSRSRFSWQYIAPTIRCTSSGSTRKRSAFSLRCAMARRLSEAVECVDWSSRAGEEAAENLQAWFALWSSQGWFCKSS